ncbi:putative metal-binding motif-containing protein [Corallococcus caeni]|uniref:putative metal-binding motif-containing protein n=1 Tax=Corallococcus caeni TaxID=3082388 RepID=UPI0030C74466
MRLFLLAVLAGVLAGCSKGDDLKSAALKVQLHYEGFRPGCVTLTVTDLADPSRQATTTVSVPEGPPPGTLSVAVFRQTGWSNDLKLLAAAKEQSCDGAQVATAQTDASLAKDGITPVDLSLSATDSDGDGFVRTEDQGTDCNDRDANQGGPMSWYPDDDNDGYGNSQLPAMVKACEGPALTASRTGDCNDRDPSVHPGQAEFRCDGQDDNCDDVKDESFDLGGTCLNDFQCAGAKVCTGTDGGVACNSTLTPTAYFRDEDGDGMAGADGGVTCAPQPEGTPTQARDCDESSIHVSSNLTEVCDRLDNNCDGRVDEGSSCNLAWQSVPEAAGTTSWRAIAVGKDLAWLAGPGTVNNVVKIEATARTLSSCVGDWNAAWISSEGQLFLAGKDGKLASKMPGEAGCTAAATPGPSVDLSGIVGFNSTGGAKPTLYAVSGGGRVFKWAFPAAPVELAVTGINLMAVTGTTAGAPLIAVGARDYMLPAPQPQVISINTETGNWVAEPLPPAVPAVYLTGVSAVNANYVYVVGHKGVILERNHGVWRTLPSPASEPDLTDVLAFSQNGLYVTTGTGTVQFFNGKTWDPVYSNPKAMRALDGPLPTTLGASGDLGANQFFNR